MNKGMYERFANREFSESIQSDMEGFASQCACDEEYNFRVTLRKKAEKKMKSTRLERGVKFQVFRGD